MMRHYELTDEQYGLIEDLLPPTKGLRRNNLYNLLERVGFGRGEMV